MLMLMFNKKKVWLLLLALVQSLSFAYAQVGDAVLQSAELSGPTTILNNHANETYNIVFEWESIVDAPTGGQAFLYFVQQNGTRVLFTGLTLPAVPDARIGDVFTTNSSFDMICQDMQLFAVFGATSGLSETPVRIEVVSFDVQVVYSAPIQVRCVQEATCQGDPHCRTFENRKYEFHGECDLVFLQHTDYRQGLGMDIHMRTKIENVYSYITTAVVRIGSDTLEVQGGPDMVYYLNGMEAADLSSVDLAGHTVSYEETDENQRSFSIWLGGLGERILIKVFRRFVSVCIKKASERSFAGSLGLVGSYATGEMVARDGVTVIEDPNEFGMEWQVQETEPVLFQDVVGPQSPQKCIMPSDRIVIAPNRHLGDSSGKMRAQAEKACAIVKEVDFDPCVHDVLATNDMDMAIAYL